VRRLLYDPLVKPARRLVSALPVLLLGLALAPAACVLHLGDDDEPVPCKVGSGGGGIGGDDGTAGAPQSTTLVNPDTLVCEEVGCWGCNCEGAIDIPTWGDCQSQCTGLAMDACSTTSGCRQAWDELCLLTDGPCSLPDGGYLGCFAVDKLGPVQGSCEDLQSQECSRHDDCLATYRRDERCTDGRDGDGDGLVDEVDECLTFGLCMTEFQRF
jgi:hypothetical protein